MENIRDTRIDLSEYYLPLPDYVNVYCYHPVFGNEIIYNIRGKPYSKRMSTRHLCNVCRFDEETTMLWLLKFGDELPTHRDQL